MAATGLLGINPYRKGVAVDISSKPTSLYIDIQNKERARTDALDKYFSEYNKNLNRAGMKTNDIDDLTRLEVESKGFYYQNKQSIQNPMLDGGKALSKLENYQIQKLDLIAKSKDAAARGMVGGKAVSGARAKGFVIGDKTFEDLKANEAPVLSKEHRPFDAATFDAYKPFSAEDFQKDLYAGNKFLSQKVIGKKSIGGKDVETTELSYDPINNKAISTITSGKYQYDKGFAHHVDKISENANELAALNPIYKKYYGSDIEIINGRANPKQVADALAISLSPYERKEAFKQYNPEYTSQFRNQPGQDSEALDAQLNRFINDLRSGKRFDGAEGANFEMLNVSPRIADEYKIDDESPAIARGVTSGKFFAIYGFQKDKNGKPTNIPDMTKVTEIPEMTFKSTIANKSLSSNFKAKGVTKSTTTKETPTTQKPSSTFGNNVKPRGK